MLVTVDIHFVSDAVQAIGHYELSFLEKCVVFIDAALAAFAHQSAPEQLVIVLFDVILFGV
jgi:hypothetical protein